MTYWMDEGEQVVHGAPDYAEFASLGLGPNEVLDFSVNVNPYGPSPLVREAIARVGIERYPDRECWQLRQTILQAELGEAAGLDLSCLVCGNGASELIWAVARAFLKPGEKTAIIGPTFGEYRAASLAAGAVVVEYRAPQEQGFLLEGDTVCAWLGAKRPQVVWLCNPNNPTGLWLSPQQLLAIAEVCQRSGAVLVVDESYWHFVFPAETASALDLICTRKAGQVLVVRSLTKDFALPGVRLGFAVAVPGIIGQLRRQLPSWNVNSVAQAAGIVALTDREYLRRTLTRLAHERNGFFGALRETGRAVVPSRTHFCLVHVESAAQVRQQLLLRRILVRDCTSFGLPQFIRVATRPVAEWRQLLQALKEIG